MFQSLHFLVATSNVIREIHHLTETLQRCHFFLCDEYSTNKRDIFLEEISRDNHCVLFMSQLFDDKKLANFEVIHLDACLRSTGQLAQFANDCVKMLNFSCYSTHPSQNFEGESVDIKFNDETGDKISFIDLCVRTIVEYAQKMHDVEFLPVANLLEAENTRLIKEASEKLNYICFFDVIPTALEEPKLADGRSLKTPVVLFMDPEEYEGCELPVVLILMDKSMFVTMIGTFGFGFFVAVTRASLKLVIVVNDSSLPDEDLKLALATEQSKTLEDRLKTAECNRFVKPATLVVGMCPDQVGHFKRELNPPQLYLPDVDGISAYVGPCSRVFHIDDVYLESDLKKLNDFGIKMILFCSKSIECEWHYHYYYYSITCIKNFQKKALCVGYFVWNALFNFRDRILRIKRLLAFLKQQSGESDTEIPRLDFDVAPHTLPKIDADCLKWKSKAEELFRIHERTFALDLCLGSILLLDSENIKYIQQGNKLSSIKSDWEIAKLWTNMSMIYLEVADGIYDGKINPGVDFWAEILKAFDTTMLAIRRHLCWSRSYERMRTIVKKLKRRYHSCSIDSCDSYFDYRAQFSDFLNINDSLLPQKINFIIRLDELWHSIRLCQNNTHEKTDLQLRSTISSKAETLSQESLELIQLCDVQCCPACIVNQRRLLLLDTQATFIFEISVRLAMISSKYSFQTNCSEKVLHSALKKLEEVVSQIREIGLTVRFRDEMLFSMAGIEE